MPIVRRKAAAVGKVGVLAVPLAEPVTLECARNNEVCRSRRGWCAGAVVWLLHRKFAELRQQKRPAAPTAYPNSRPAGSKAGRAKAAKRV